MWGIRLQLANAKDNFLKKWHVIFKCSSAHAPHALTNALIKRKSNFPHICIRKFRVEQLQSYIWLTASYIGKYFRISSYIRKPFLIYDFATAPLWISLYMRKIWFSFYQCGQYKMRSWPSSVQCECEACAHNFPIIVISEFQKRHAILQTFLAAWAHNWPIYSLTQFQEQQAPKSHKLPLHCKNGYRFSRSSQDVTNQTLPGREKFFPGQGKSA